ncbi:MAG: membrane dipeptidase [Planctomycetes bacterium]|nr:membrane dipeptidase [Planctomycetota bacterium]
MLIFDCHLDISMNAMQWNRDVTRPLEEIRRREAHLTDFLDRGQGTVSLGEMRRGQIGLCVATLIGRCTSEKSPLRQLMAYESPEIAWSVTQGQLAWYRQMEDDGQMRQIRDLASLREHALLWQNDPPPDAPIGYIMSLEGADSILTPDHLQRSYDQGLRAIGLSHYGPGRYAGGTNSDTHLAPEGKRLLEEMERLGMIVDATHLNDESFWEVLENFGGAIWASHQNCRELVPGVRQFSDEQLRALIERGAVMGMALDNWMLVPDWSRGKSTPEGSGVTLSNAVDHIDHICQLAGSAQHCGIGTDLDGGFGREQCPTDLETIADLQKIPPMLAERGYSEEDIAGIMHGNWLQLLERAWAE